MQQVTHHSDMVVNAHNTHAKACALTVGFEARAFMGGVRILRLVALMLIVRTTVIRRLMVILLAMTFMSMPVLVLVLAAC